MSEITKIGDLEFSPYISEQDIINRIRVLANMINDDYDGQIVDIIVILKGAFIFGADLIRNLKIPHRIHFAQCSSYEGTRSTGNVKICMDNDVDLKGCQIIIVEDIIDTGQTLLDFISYLNDSDPLDISIAALLHKHKVSNFPYPVDYCGFKIDDNFVVGYGMDYNEEGRNLPDILVIADEEE